MFLPLTSNERSQDIKISKYGIIISQVVYYRESLDRLSCGCLPLRGLTDLQLINGRLFHVNGIENKRLFTVKMTPIEYLQKLHTIFCN